VRTPISPLSGTQGEKSCSRLKRGEGSFSSRKKGALLSPPGRKERTGIVHRDGKKMVPPAACRRKGREGRSSSTSRPAARQRRGKALGRQYAPGRKRGLACHRVSYQGGFLPRGHRLGSCCSDIPLQTLPLRTEKRAADRQKARVGGKRVKRPGIPSTGRPCRNEKKGRPHKNPKTG